MLTRDDALGISEAVLGHANAAGAEDASVSVRSGIESYARFADNHVTTSGRAETLEVTATVWVDRKRGAATGSDAAPATLKRLAAEAVEIARVSPVHREYVPTPGPVTYAESRGFAAATADIDVNARAAALAGALAACRTSKVTGAGFHMATASARATATANGNRRYFQSSEAAFSLTARSADETGSGYFAGDHFDVARLDVAGIADRAVDKAVRSREPRPIEPGAYPVILEPQAVADLMGFFVGSLDARMAEEGRSAFSAKGKGTRIGERLFDPRLVLYSDPMHPELPVAPATDEGVPASRLSIVRGGVLENLASSRFWAAEQKREPTPGPVNYVMESTVASTPADAMVKPMKRGLLISRFWYVRLVDPRSLVVTGLTRDGLWWVENGEVRHPVRNLRFNQSVLAMLAPWNVDAIGAPVRLSPFMVPALRLGSFTFTSISDAI